MMDSVLIKIRNLTKIYKMGENEVRALDGIPEIGRAHV